MTSINSPYKPEMREAARRALTNRGIGVRSIAARGRPRNSFLELSGEIDGRCTVRTSQDRWVSFGESREGWRTLDEVKWVAVAALDDQDAPSRVDVYFFGAGNVRQAFDASRAARESAGHALSRGGMWVALDYVDSDRASAVGSGLKEKALWTESFSLAELTADDDDATAASPEPRDPSPPSMSIREAKIALSRHYGVDPEAIEIVIRG